MCNLVKYSNHNSSQSSVAYRLYKVTSQSIFLFGNTGWETITSHDEFFHLSDGKPLRSRRCDCEAALQSELRVEAGAAVTTGHFRTPV